MKYFVVFSLKLARTQLFSYGYNSNNKNFIKVP